MSLALVARLNTSSSSACKPMASTALRMPPPSAHRELERAVFRFVLETRPMAMVMRKFDTAMAKPASSVPVRSCLRESTSVAMGPDAKDISITENMDMENRPSVDTSMDTMKLTTQLTNSAVLVSSSTEIRIAPSATGMR